VDALTHILQETADVGPATAMRIAESYARAVGGLGLHAPLPAGDLIAQNTRTPTLAAIKAIDNYKALVENKAALRETKAYLWGKEAIAEALCQKQQHLDSIVTTHEAGDVAIEKKSREGCCRGDPIENRGLFRAHRLFWLQVVPLNLIFPFASDPIILTRTSFPTLTTSSTSSTRYRGPAR